MGKPFVEKILLPIGENADTWTTSPRTGVVLRGPLHQVPFGGSLDFPFNFGFDENVEFPDNSAAGRSGSADIIPSGALDFAVQRGHATRDDTSFNMWVTCDHKDPHLRRL